MTTQHYLLEPVSGENTMEVVGISNDEQVIAEWKCKYMLYADIAAIDCDSYTESVAILKEIGDKW
jgi:hypothetical protein